MFKMQLSLENSKDNNYDLFFPLSLTITAAGRQTEHFPDRRFQVRHRVATMFFGHSQTLAGLVLLRSPRKLIEESDPT